MTFVVVETHEDPIRGRSIRTFGPFIEAWEAEAYRRRKHFDNYLVQGYWNRDKTYVAKIEIPS